MFFKKNVYLFKYYQQVIKEFNKNIFDYKDYSPGTTMFFDVVKEQWY